MINMSESSENRVLKIGILKNGTIGSSLLLAFLLDERAEAKRIDVLEVTSGAKMNPPELCSKTMEKLLELNPELIILSSPNAALPGPKKVREMAGTIPTIIISDSPAKKAVDEFMNTINCKLLNNIYTKSSQKELLGLGDWWFQNKGA